MSSKSKVKRKKLTFNTKTKAMNILGVPKTHFFESEPLTDVKEAFVKNLVTKKNDHSDGNWSVDNAIKHFVLVNYDS